MEGDRPPRRGASRTTRAATSARGASPAHRFFFAPDEVEPLGAEAPATRRCACWWPASATSSSATTASASRSPTGSRARALPAGVEVVDYGIRGMDLAYALRRRLRRRRPARRRAARRAAGHAVRDRARARRRRAGRRRARHGPGHGAGARPRARRAAAAHAASSAASPQTRMTGDEEDVVAEPRPSPCGRRWTPAMRARRVAAGASSTPEQRSDRHEQSRQPAAQLVLLALLLAAAVGAADRCPGARDPALPRDPGDVDAPHEGQRRRGRARRQQHDRPRQPRRLRPRTACAW